MLHNNLVAAIITFLLAIIWIRFIGYLANKQLLSSSVSRKIIHIGTGPLFVLCWLLFDQNPSGRYLAVIAPAFNAVLFGLTGLGIIKDPSSVNSMARSGDKKELLRGPFLYGIAFVVITILFWKDVEIGIIALMILCGGDGMADLIGKRFGSKTIPWSARKTWIGSLGMLVCGFLLAVSMIWIFTAAGVFHPIWGKTISNIFILSIVATLIESLTLNDLDNITVPAVTCLFGLILF